MSKPVPCGLCGEPTLSTSTRRCDRCWELERRIQADPLLARAILATCTVGSAPRAEPEGEEPADPRALMARLLAFSRCFEGGTPAAAFLVHFASADDPAEVVELHLTSDGADVAGDLVDEILFARDELGMEDIWTWRRLTVLATALACAQDDSGPVPGGEVAAAVAGEIEDLYRAVVAAQAKAERV